jgi:hypothetical protein
MQRAVALASAVVALMAVELSAQDRPSFAGTWTMVADANAPAPGARGDRAGGPPPDGAPPAGARGGGRMGRGGRGGFAAIIGLGREATIAQDGATLTITRSTQAGEIKTVYNLDGSESRNTITGPGGNSLEQVSRARWDGNTLRVTTTMTLGDNPVETTLSLSLDEAGALVVESGGAGRGGRGGSVTLKYTKS